MSQTVTRSNVEAIASAMPSAMVNRLDERVFVMGRTLARSGACSAIRAA